MRTPLRPLTDEERAALTKLRQDAADPVLQDQLLAELVVARAVFRKVRRVMRCQPPDVRRALDGLPHKPRSNFQEFSND